MSIVQALKTNADGSIHLTVLCTCGKTFETNFTHGGRRTDFAPPGHDTCELWEGGFMQLLREITVAQMEEEPWTPYTIESTPNQRVIDWRKKA